MKHRGQAWPSNTTSTPSTAHHSGCTWWPKSIKQEQRWGKTGAKPNGQPVIYFRNKFLHFSTLKLGQITTFCTWVICGFISHWQDMGESGMKYILEFSVKDIVGEVSSVLFPFICSLSCLSLLEYEFSQIILTFDPFTLPESTWRWVYTEWTQGHKSLKYTKRFIIRYIDTQIW